MFTNLEVNDNSQFRKLSLDCNPISRNAFFLQAVVKLYNGCLLWKKNVVEIRQYQNELKYLFASEGGAWWFTPSLPILNEASVSHSGAVT